MIHITDENGIVRPAKVGEPVRFRNGSEYIMGRNGELRVVRPDGNDKHLSPSKAARKARRAAELEQLRRR